MERLRDRRANERFHEREAFGHDHERGHDVHRFHDDGGHGHSERHFESEAPHGHGGHGRHTDDGDVWNHFKNWRSFEDVQKLENLFKKEWFDGQHDFKFDNDYWRGIQRDALEHWKKAKEQHGDFDWKEIQRFGNDFGKKLHKELNEKFGKDFQKKLENEWKHLYKKFDDARFGERPHEHGPHGRNEGWWHSEYDELHEDDEHPHHRDSHGEHADGVHTWTFDGDADEITRRVLDSVHEHLEELRLHEMLKGTEVDGEALHRKIVEALKEAGVEHRGGAR